MIDTDFRRCVELGAIMQELRLLESGGIPSRAAAPDLSSVEIARRVAFLHSVGQSVLEKPDPRPTTPEVKT